MHIFRAPGSWNWQNYKLKEHLPWGWFQHNKVCTRGIFLYQFTTFLYLAESDRRYTRFFVSLSKHHIQICCAFRNFGATCCSKHDRFTLFETCSVRCFTKSVILSRPDTMNCLAKWNGSRSREFKFGFRNSLFWFPGNIKWKRPKQQKLRLQILSCQS